MSRLLFSLLSTLLAVTLLAGNANAAATGKYLSRLSMHSDIQTPYRVLAQGKKPLPPKPKAKPLVRKPQTAPRVQPRSVSGRPLVGSRLPSKRQIAALPRKPAVSTAAAGRFNANTVKPAARALSSKPLTVASRTATIDQLRKLPKPKHIPYAGGRIRSFVTKTDETYYRVYSNGKDTGSFLTKTPPSSRKMARETLALPPGNKATHIQKVLVPAGTRMIRSRALPVPAFGRRGGGEQFLLMNKIPKERFESGRILR